MPLSVCLGVAMICDSVNFYVRLEPPGGKAARKYKLLAVYLLGELTPRRNVRLPLMAAIAAPLNTRCCEVPR